MENGKLYHVFSLTDSITGELVYIGSSSGIYDRRRLLFAQSISAPKSEFRKYLNDCESTGMRPKLKVLVERGDRKAADKVKAMLVGGLHPRFNKKFNVDK